MVAIVFLGFFAIATPLAALSIQLNEVLGYRPLIVGWVIGLQSLVTVLSRHRGGTFSDAHGPRRAVLIGLPLTAVAGVIYTLSGLHALTPPSSLALVLLGRILTGFGESLFITGCMAWGIARVGMPNTGKVMAWQGIALYGAIGVGAPAGLSLQEHFGFISVGAVATLAPFLALAVAILARANSARSGKPSSRVPFHKVFYLIRNHGIVLALASTPFAAMATFLALYFEHRHWPLAGTALACFTGGYLLIRFLFAHLPDRLGGIRVAGVSLVIELAGQLLLFLAPNPYLAIAGAILTGIGFSLIFPSMGVEAVRRVPVEQRGAAVGNFIAFFDIAIGLTGPIVGLLIDHIGYSAPFSVGTVAVLLALFFLARLRTR
jgi:predicted MFS family arabinose efflux permease